MPRGTNKTAGRNRPIIVDDDGGWRVCLFCSDYSVDCCYLAINHVLPFVLYLLQTHTPKTTQQYGFPNNTASCGARCDVLGGGTCLTTAHLHPMFD